MKVHTSHISFSNCGHRLPLYPQQNKYVTVTSKANKMKQTSKTYSIYCLLEIKPESSKMVLLILPPIYALWLLALGKKLLNKQNKPDSFFTFFAFSFFILNIAQIIALPFISFTFIQEHNQELMLFGKIYFSFFIPTLLMLSSISVNYDRLQNDDKHYSITDFRDYLNRFFNFFFWPFYIWTFQNNINKYI